MRPRKNSVFGEVFRVVLSLWLHLLYVFGIPYHIKSILFLFIFFKRKEWTLKISNEGP